MKTLLFAAAVAAGLAAAPALAQPGSEPQIAVRVADLDLATERGRRTLDRRLLNAAWTACGTPSPADPRGHSNLTACIAEARAAAIAQRNAILAAARRQAPSALASR